MEPAYTLPDYMAFLHKQAPTAVDALPAYTRRIAMMPSVVHANWSFRDNDDVATSSAAIVPVRVHTLADSSDDASDTPEDRILPPA